MYLRVLLLFALLFCSVLNPLTVWAEDDDMVAPAKLFTQLGQLSLGDDFDADSAISGFGKLLSTKYDVTTLRHTISFKYGQIVTEEASPLHPAIIINMKLTGSGAAKTLSGIGIGTPMKKVITIYGLSKFVSNNYQGSVHIYENDAETVRTTFIYERDTAKVTSIQIEELYQ